MIVPTRAGPDDLPCLSPGEAHLWWWPRRPGFESGDQRRPRIDALLHTTLRHYLGGRQARIEREPHGRPFLAMPDAPDFNLSDTDGGTVLAIVGTGRIGADIERLDRRVPADRLARRWFSDTEQAALAHLPQSVQAGAFIHLWTAKEAACKATGTGIFGHLDRWRFALGADDPVPLQPLPIEAGTPEDWQFVRVTPAPGFTVVLACCRVGLRRVRLILSEH